MIEIILISLMIAGVLAIPTKKKPPIKRYDDKVIQFIVGKPMLVDKEKND